MRLEDNWENSLFGNDWGLIKVIWLIFFVWSFVCDFGDVKKITRQLTIEFL